MRGYWRDEQGSTAIEYAMIATLIAVVLIGALSAIGQQMLARFNQVAAAFP